MVDVTLPSLGESVTEGIITRWFKKVGDAVARDEPLLEVSTDKVDSELPSPAAGVLVAIVAEEGDTVETGSRVGVIDESAVAMPRTEAASAELPGRSAPAGATPPRSAAATPGLVISPVVRRILADGGVEASTIRGTGPGGAITRRDAERAVALGPTEELIVPLSHGQRRMGQHMAASALSAPQGYVAIEVQTEVFERLGARGSISGDGVPVGAETLVARAAVRALAEFTTLNASVEDDHLIVFRSVNVGFVRAADSATLVPVVHAATRLSLRALARRVADLDERLHARQLMADDLMGGTFSVIGPLSAHTLSIAPVLIQPQVAMLSLGAPRRESPEGAEAARWRIVLGLTFDHRACEPFTAARFLERVGALLDDLDLDAEL